MESHVLNEQLKRLEPKETLCRFCNERHSEKMDRNYFAPVFKEVDRTELVVYSSVKFKKIEIGIPRCNHGFVIHTGSSFNGWLIGLGICTVLAILGFIIFGIFGFFSFIVCFVLAFITPFFISDMLVKKKGILTEKDGAKKEPLVQEFVISGWSMTQPSPR